MMHCVGNVVNMAMGYFMSMPLWPTISRSHDAHRRSRQAVAACFKQHMRSGSPCCRRRACQGALHGL